MLRQPPSSTLFPYTTLFRSMTPRDLTKCAVRQAKYAFITLPDGGIANDPVLMRHRVVRSEEHTSELQSHSDLVCRLLLEKKNRRGQSPPTPRAAAPIRPLCH